MGDKFTSRMKGLDWVAHSILTRLFNYRDIDKDDSLYLRRYKIIAKGRFKLFLHNIRRSDSDRDLHDHPWDFATLCLKGGYVEELPHDQRRILRPGRVFSNKAEHAHRVRLFHDVFKNVKEKQTWTLVHTKTSRRLWGFWVDGRFVDWRTYLNLPADTPDGEEDV